MQVTTILQELLKTSIHQTRINNLIVMIEGIIRCKELKLTSLGRALEIKGKECSAINRVDRLLGNSYYQNKSIEIYRVMALKLIGELTSPIIIVDWSSIPNSHLSSSGEQCILRASLAAPGRSLTIYEEVHPKAKEGNKQTHKEFLNNLSLVIPSNSKPIIITDAGFKNPWFKEVLFLGWEYIGRLNNCIHYDDGGGFKSLPELFKKASNKPLSFGLATIAKTNPLPTNLYIYKKFPKGRKHRGSTGKILTHKQSRKNAKSNSLPWVIASSLSGENIESTIIKYYKLRMTIEESFRDIKSTQYGLSLNENSTLDAKRFTVWLLLAALTHFITWVVGYKAEKLNLHYDFQANSYKYRRVLSFPFLGLQIIRKRINIPINMEEIQLAWGVFYE